MECNKIYQRSWETGISKSGLGLFKYKDAAFRYRYGNEFGGTYGNIRNSIRLKSTRSTNPLGSGRTVRQGTLGEIGMEIRNSLSDNATSGGARPAPRRPVDEFRSLLSGSIFTEEVSWKDCDTSAKLQSRLYDILDRGILKITDIPKIPEEYEPCFSTDGQLNFYGFDSEDDSHGLPHFYQFATRDFVYISASFRLLFRYVVQEHNLNSKNHIVWGTNIEYDLGNLLKDWDVTKDTCILKWTKGGLKKFELEYPVNQLPWAGKDDHDGFMKVWDTLNHWKMGVKDLGKVLSEHLGYDFNKLDKDFYSLKYSAMDAILSRSYACVQKKYYDNKGITLKFTPGATALGYYMKGHTPKGDLFCKHKIFDTHTDKELQWLIEGLRGGRTEVFSLKEYRGTVGYYDINSAYPYSMKFGIFPHLSRKTKVFKHSAIENLIKGGYEGLVDCEVDATGVNEFTRYIPYLGTIEPKTGRYIFPLGKWKSKYTVFEIRKALLLGYKFKFCEGLMYEPSQYQPFAEFVDFCYSIRDEGTRKNDKILRDIGKSLGNNLYGKFGQRLRFTELDDPKNFKAADIMDCIKIGDGVLIEKDEGFAPHSNCIWSIYITAICRDLLYNHMLNAWSVGNEVLYCDTDSIFIYGGDRPESHQTNLGALKHEGDLSMFKAILPKTYIYEIGGKTCYKAKGVPEDQKKIFLTRGMVEYKKPMKIREAMRRKNFNQDDPDAKDLTPGMSSVNAWITVHKELKGKYTKRLVAEDGATTPIILG